MGSAWVAKSAMALTKRYPFLSMDFRSGASKYLFFMSLNRLRLFRCCAAVMSCVTGKNSFIYSMTFLSVSRLRHSSSTPFPISRMYCSANCRVIRASSIRSMMFEVCFVIHVRFAVRSARFKVFWHTTRTGVMAALMEQLPSCEFMITK